MRSEIFAYVNYKSTPLVSYYVFIFCISIILVEYVAWFSKNIYVVNGFLTILLAFLIGFRFLLKGGKKFLIKFVLNIGIVTILVSVVGLSRTSIVLKQASPELFSNQVGIIKSHGGVIQSEIERRKNKQRFVVELHEKNSSTKALVTTSPYPEFQYGDNVQVNGALLVPHDFKTETGNLFDYDTYLAKDQIFFLIKNGKVEKATFQQNMSFFEKINSKLYKLKNYLVNLIDHSLPSPQSSLLAGLLIAGKKAIPENIMNEFKIAGVVHVVVLSGYNLTIVAVAVMAILKKIPRTFRLVIGAILIILFSLMVGETATVVRSVIMAIIALFAEGIYENYKAIRALVFTAFAMLFYNPLYLLHDPSFQLSFLATFGLMLVSPILNTFLSKYAAWFPTAFGIKELFIGTVSTQVFVTPFLIYGSGLISLVALPVNILILSIVPTVMLIGAIYMCMYWVSHILHSGFILLILNNVSLFISFITYLLLSYQLFIVHFFVSLPNAAIYIKHVPVWNVLMVYFIELSVIFFYFKKELFKSLFRLGFQIENVSLTPPS